MPTRDKEKYNAYMREYMYKRYYKIRQEMLDELGGQCVKCGSKERLEIDHKDPNSKVIELTDSHSEQLYKEELVKCQLLCRKCHEDKSIKEKGHNRAQHGTITMYTHHKCRCIECSEVNRILSRKYKKTYLAKKALMGR